MTSYRIPNGPCSTCPYARSTPPGVWDCTEYERLPEYDKATGSQPIGVFCCHYDNGDLCGGWLATHDPRELLSLRLAVSMGDVDPAVFNYHTTAPCWSSGQEACDEGAVYGPPGPEAQVAIEKIETRKNRKSD